MEIRKFSYTPILGWSASRYEVFSACKRQYYYQYYGKYDQEYSRDRIFHLKALTSIPMETGSLVHDIVKVTLERFIKSQAPIDRRRFDGYVKNLTEKRCRQVQFTEVHYKESESVSPAELLPKIETCLNNFLASERWEWIKENAISSKDEWVVEPPGYGEARLGELKVYCKVDFLLPFDGSVIIFDWKTGKPSEEKHEKQLTGYAAWAASHLSLEADAISSVLAYLYPDYYEIEIFPSEEDLARFAEQIREETREMYSYCSNVDENIPIGKDEFILTDNLNTCSFCTFRELCGREGRIEGGFVI